MLEDKIQHRQSVWEKLDDSILSMEAFLETIELVKANFLSFEDDPEPKKMSPFQKEIVRGFDRKLRQGRAILKQLKAIRGKAESTSSLVRSPLLLLDGISLERYVLLLCRN